MAGGAEDEREAGVDLRMEPAGAGNRQEHRRQSPPRMLRRRHGPRETASAPIPDELLLEIFLRIPNPTDLVRTSAACVSFRRLVTDRSFLRQYRKLHAPPLLGFLASKGFHPAEPPYPSASAASAVALAADFSFSFVPDPATPGHRWDVRDIRDGRVLLGGSPPEKVSGAVFTEMVVCDPLHRRHLLLPPIPDDLAANPLMRLRPHFCEIFLVPEGGGDEGETATAEETSFRVIWMVQCEAKLVAFVFSSSTRQWRAIASQSWNNLLAGLSFTDATFFYWRHYAYGCFYWLPEWVCGTEMLVLDIQRMEFSIVEPPTEAKGSFRLNIVMVEAGEGKPGMFVLGHDPSGGDYTILRNNGGSSGQWKKEKIIPLPLGSRYAFRRSTGPYLVVDQWGSSSLEPSLCTVDLKTLQLERVCASVFGRTYINYPPSLSSPKVSSGTQECGEKDIPEQGAEMRQAEESTGHPYGESTADVMNAGDQAGVSETRDGAD